MPLSYLFLYLNLIIKLDTLNIQGTGYFTSDNEPDGIENATHNTFAKLTWIFVLLFKINKT
jgi:hypothetical protein